MSIRFCRSHLRLLSVAVHGDEITTKPRQFILPAREYKILFDGVPSVRQAIARVSCAKVLFGLITKSLHQIGLEPAPCSIGLSQVFKTLAVVLK